MKRLNSSLELVAAILVTTACNVTSTGHDTGGVDGVDGAGDCPNGATVVLSDWVSTQIALADTEGIPLSASFISTASSKTAGLAFALSGDVVLPRAAPSSRRVVLLDRFGTNVITWLDPATAQVLGQLAVGTGFESNPSDYVETDERLAWISRWGQNADPGHEPHDTGGDVLLVDTERFEIVDNIVLEPEGDLPPRPSGMTLAAGEVVVALERVNEDYSEWGEARLVGISVAERTVTWEVALDGLKNCGPPVPFPRGERWLVACSGVSTWDGTIEDLRESALVVLDASGSPPSEMQRIPADAITDGEPIQPDLAFATDSVVLLKTQTPYGGSAHNRWLAYDLDRAQTTTLLEARPAADGSGQGLVYGDLVCAPGCSDVCLLADADRGVLQRARATADGSIEVIDPVVVEDDVGLPPVGLAYR